MSHNNLLHLSRVGVWNLTLRSLTRLGELGRYLQRGHLLWSEYRLWGEQPPSCLLLGSSTLQIACGRLPSRTSTWRNVTVCNGTMKNELPVNWCFKLLSRRCSIVRLLLFTVSAEAPPSRYLCFSASASLPTLQESQRLYWGRRII